METISRYLLTFLLNSLWQIPLVTAVAMLVCRTLRNGPAAHRYAVWVASLLAAMVLPLASLRTVKPVAPVRLTVSYAPPAIASNPSSDDPAVNASANRAPASDLRIFSFAQTTATVLLGCYLLFLLFQLVRLARAWNRTRQICRAAQPCSTPPLVERVWVRCLEAFDVTGVELLASSRVSSPVTAGKTIVLPESLFYATSEEVLTTAIGHEMAHIARHDFAGNVISELLYLPVSFHPASWLIRREVGRTREMACDELVTQKLMEPVTYARSMMTIAAAMTALPRPGCTLGVFDGDILEERIRRLLERPVANLKRARLLLVTGLSVLGVCVAIASGLALSARAQSGTQGEMKLAGEAYNKGDFKAAVQHFANAVALEPGNFNAKLFLANALMREFFAEREKPDSALMAGARAQYLDILAQDPRNKLAMQGAMVVAIDTKQMREAREWALKLIQLDPKDKTAYYTAGFLDWAIVYPEFQRAKQAAGGRPDDYSISDASLRKRLRDQFEPHIEEGFRMLQVALQLDPDYFDAMAYMNLLARLKSGLVDDPVGSALLMQKADALIPYVLAAKRRQGPPQAPEPMHLDVTGPPPGPASAHAVLTAPPPPPAPPHPPAVADNQPASAAPPPRQRNVAERPDTFWHVMGSTEMPANTLVRLLHEKGFWPTLLTSSEDNLVRVMVGPYRDAQSLEQARASLEAAAFRPIRQW
jgi:beta-lactamase regulating signal transducer with metallopeptidase domain/cell division septation protein DedD